MTELIYGIAGQIFQHNRPIRDALYRRFVKSFPCCACRKWWSIDPAHTGPHSHGAKGCDLRCIPLCRKCHQAFDASPLKFAARHVLDIDRLIQTYRELYDLNYPERRIRIDSPELPDSGTAPLATSLPAEVTP